MHLYERDCQDPTVFGRGKCAGHVPLYSYRSEGEALKGAEPRRLYLNGDWKFAYVERPDALPEGFSETDFDDATLRSQELFSLNFGLTSWLAKGLYIEPTVSFGLNGPGDSFALGVTLPYTF